VGEVEVVKLLLRNTQAPGDAIMMTALLRDIHKTYPGKYLICADFRGYMGVVQNNPYHTRISPTASDVIVEVGCSTNFLKQRAYLGLHWIELATKQFNIKTELNVKTTECRGEIYLSKNEDRPIINPPYWLIFAGGKYDQNTKWWPTQNYQTVVNKIPQIKWIQCGREDHWHIPLDNVINMIGKTKMRELFRLIKFADGIVCPISMPIHISGALPKKGKPRSVVVIGGGKEAPHIVHYPGNNFLSTIGEMDCAGDFGCWSQDVMHTPEFPIHLACKNPLNNFAACMQKITPERVIEAVLTSQKH